MLGEIQREMAAATPLDWAMGLFFVGMFALALGAAVCSAWRAARRRFSDRPDA